MSGPSPGEPTTGRKEPNGHYVEPGWVSAALFAVEDFGAAIHDPCQGLGHIPKSARAAGLRATGADLIPRFPGQRPTNFFVELQRIRAARWLWELPVRRVWLINPRPSVPPVTYILAGARPCNGSKEYCWVILEHGWEGYPEIWPLDCNP